MTSPLLAVSRKIANNASIPYVRHRRLAERDPRVLARERRSRQLSTVACTASFFLSQRFLPLSLPLLLVVVSRSSRFAPLAVFLSGAVDGDISCGEINSTPRRIIMARCGYDTSRMQRRHLARARARAHSQRIITARERAHIHRCQTICQRASARWQ